LFREWSVETTLRGQSQQALVQQVADQESDAPVSNVFYRKTLLNTRFWPANGSAAVKFVARTEDLAGQVLPSVLTISGTSAGLQAEYSYANGSNGSAAYQEGMMAEFLREAARRLP
jgi:hypothetical protein